MTISSYNEKINAMKHFLFIFPTFFLISCSLKYGSATYDENSIPEFTFNNATYITYEDNVETMNLETEKMEQYKDGSSTYAKNVQFTISDKDGSVTTKGKCGLLGSNSDEKKYTLFDNIEIENLKDDIKLSADSLKWNGKTEQLTGSRTDLVTIQKGNTIIQGSGFSASAVSRKYAFTGVVTGQTNTNSQQGEELDVEKN